MYLESDDRKEVPLWACVSEHGSTCLPQLAELFGLQEEVESSKGKLLRTMPRGLKVHWSSASSRGRQSLLPLALSVSDTASQHSTAQHKEQVVFLNGKIVETQD